MRGPVSEGVPHKPLVGRGWNWILSLPAKGASRGWGRRHTPRVELVVMVRGAVLALEVTDDRTADVTMFPTLVESSVAPLGEGRISDGFADAAYDRRRGFSVLKDHGLRSGIRITPGASR